MDILGLVKSDQLFDLELKHPITEKPLGVIVKLRSSQSAEVKTVERQNQDGINLRMQKGKSLKAAALEANAEARAAAMIESWDWQNQDLTLGEEASPECTQKNKLLLVANDYFFDQIIEASSNLENFTERARKR
tara:strand:+ start:8124 stop:8525 length:402 start_codon:yes stop_codon:yes gene_type:complete